MARQRSPSHSSSAPTWTQRAGAHAEPCGDCPARLPEGARRLGITTQKQSPDLLMVAFLYSENGAYDQLYVGNYAILQMRDVLARVEGVGDVQIFRVRIQSIWLDPERVSRRQPDGAGGRDTQDANASGGSARAAANSARQREGFSSS